MAESNIRMEFINAAIRKVAEIGMENLRTKQIAGEVGLSEASMYRYFGSKEEILEAAFLEVDRRLSDLLSNSRYLRENQNRSFFELISEIWHTVYRYLIDHRDETVFLIRYRYSAYYTMEVRGKRQAYSGAFDKAYESVEKTYGQGIESYRGFLVNYIFELTLSFAEKVITGRIADTPETEERAWRAISAAAKVLMEMPTQE